MTTPQTAGRPGLDHTMSFIGPDESVSYRGKAMTITTLTRHTPTPANKSTGKSLPIVRYHELELDGPFATAIITVLEDGMWRSNIMRLAIDTAAEIQEGLTGTEAITILQGMFHRQKNNPMGKKARLKSDVSVYKPHIPRSKAPPLEERHRPTAKDANTGKTLPIVGYREIDLQNLSVTAVISVMDQNMLRSELVHLSYQEASEIRASFEPRHPDTISASMSRRQRENKIANTPNHNKVAVHRPLHQTPKATDASNGPKAPLSLMLGR